MYFLSGHDQVWGLRKVQAGLRPQEVRQETTSTTSETGLSPYSLPCPSFSPPPILRCPNMAVQVAEECEEEDADMAENDPDLKPVVSPMLHVLCVQWLLKVLCVCVFYRR